MTAADAIRAFYLLYAEREGKTRYGDKTPGYVKEMRRIQRVLPEARFIHIIRDGRDVSLSHMRMNWGPETYEQSARLWRNRIRKARKMAPFDRPLHRGPLRGPGRRHRGRAAHASATSSSSISTR